eukprot:scaffold574_cov333-Pavlova_lutheri.AAC.30
MTTWIEPRTPTGPFPFRKEIFSNHRSLRKETPTRPGPPTGVPRRVGSSGRRNIARRGQGSRGDTRVSVTFGVARRPRGAPHRPCYQLLDGSERTASTETRRELPTRTQQAVPHRHGLSSVHWNRHRDARSGPPGRLRRSRCWSKSRPSNETDDEGRLYKERGRNRKRGHPEEGLFRAHLENPAQEDALNVQVSTKRRMLRMATENAGR